MGWIIIKPRWRIGFADMTDLDESIIVQWQHRHRLVLILTMGFLVPTLVAGLAWGDWKGGFVFAGLTRLCFVQHVGYLSPCTMTSVYSQSTFCVNSLAHWMGEKKFDNKLTPGDHFLTALFTVGEGYHNFHHQFPNDYRNALKWFQYDPTKWFIWSMANLGLASRLKRFPQNEIDKGLFTVQLQALFDEANDIKWPIRNSELPVMSWDEFQAECHSRNLIAISGYVHDVSSFAGDHPGGPHLIGRMIGVDATIPFCGGIYDHSNAAHNLLAMFRVGILEGVTDFVDGNRAEGSVNPTSSRTSSSATTVKGDATPVAYDRINGYSHSMRGSRQLLKPAPSQILQIVRSNPFNQGIRGYVSESVETRI